MKIDKVCKLPLWAGFSLPSASVNKILLGHKHSLPSVHCLCLHCDGRGILADTKCLPKGGGGVKVFAT